MLVLIAAMAASVPVHLPARTVRTMIRDARRIVERSGNRVWPGYARAPFRIQLVEPAREVLFCSPPLAGFTPLAMDTVTGCALQTRPRALPLDVSGASDVAGMSVIQMGSPAALEESRAGWIVTLLHEGFHQYQSTLPGYAAAVDEVRTGLGHSGGAWMLDHPFPYAEPAVGTAFARLAERGGRFLAAPAGRDPYPLIVAYLEARRDARAAVGERNWRYDEFQVGQEGVARWAELARASVAGRTDDGIALVAVDRRQGLATSLRAIRTQGLHMWKRSSFYVLGAVEAEMLGRISPGWQRTYARAPFSIGAQLEAAIGSSPAA